MRYKNYFLERYGIDQYEISIHYLGFFIVSKFFYLQREKRCWSSALKLTLIISMTGLFHLIPKVVFPQNLLYEYPLEGRIKRPFLSYTVKKSRESIVINGKWNKPQWCSVKEVYLSNYMGQIPSFRPDVRVKMMYDDDNIYVIFRVSDRFVRSVVEEYNGPVSTDACVEFFFSPDVNLPERYFNLEINAGGTPLMAYHIYHQKEYQKFSVEDLKKIEIAHSLPDRVDPEIQTSIVWTIEYKLPFSVLKKYGSVIHPKAGVTWKANFYKTASKGSNPHYLTWSYVDNLKPSFHLPQFFGEIEFGK